MAGSGFTVADYEEEVEVWPENWPAFSLLRMMQTQWDLGGMNGVRIGLKYPVLFEIMDRQRLDGDEWWQMFDDIRLMEIEALNTMRGE